MLLLLARQKFPKPRMFPEVMVRERVKELEVPRPYLLLSDVSYESATFAIL
jgi:hypothetical protein